MGKILTISVAAYNVEKYIKQTLESLIDEDIVDELEVFVVDDGGTDGTLKIVQEYAEKYPQSIFPVHKENGGYGSTVNYSIAHATGLFFKLLDGDDWFDGRALKSLIGTLRTTEADVIVSPYKQGPDEAGLKIKKRTWMKYCGKTLKISELKNEQIPMWSLTYRTNVLKKTKMELPKHMLYTDNIYDIMPFTNVESVQFISDAVYCYRTDRDGQSNSKTSRMKHVDEIVEISFLMCKFSKRSVVVGKRCQNFIEFRCAGVCRNVIDALMLFPTNEVGLSRIKSYESEVKKISPEIYKKVPKVGKLGKFIGLMRHSGYIPYWLFGIKHKDGIEI